MIFMTVKYPELFNNLLADLSGRLNTNAYPINHYVYTLTHSIIIINAHILHQITRSRQITEVKLQRARLVLWLVTTRESRVVLILFFVLFLTFRFLFFCFLSLLSVCVRGNLL